MRQVPVHATDRLKKLEAINEKVKFIENKFQYNREIG